MMPPNTVWRFKVVKITAYDDSTDLSEILVSLPQTRLLAILKKVNINTVGELRSATAADPDWMAATEGIGPASIDVLNGIIGSGSDASMASRAEAVNAAGEALRLVNDCSGILKWGFHSLKDKGGEIRMYLTLPGRLRARVMGRDKNFQPLPPLSSYD